jgi:hypothetical protein
MECLETGECAFLSTKQYNLYLEEKENMSNIHGKTLNGMPGDRRFSNINNTIFFSKK